MPALHSLSGTVCAYMHRDTPPTYEDSTFSDTLGSVLAACSDCTGAAVFMLTQWFALVLCVLMWSGMLTVCMLQAQRIAPPYTAPAVASALRLSVSGLSPDQGYAWATGGLEGLLQQLQDEEELRLPEVMRPRPKW